MMLKLLGFVDQIGERGLGRRGRDLIISKPYQREISGEFIEFTSGLTGREPKGLGHDAIDRHRATKAIIEAAGLDPDEWGICDTCDGASVHPDDQGDLDEWERTDPPEGDGLQVWETVSEGSPITPPFESKEALVKYLVQNGTDWDEPWSRDSAENFVGAEWAPSLVASSGKVQKGYDAVGGGEQP